MDRREFIKISGAGLAAAGVSACQPKTQTAQTASAEPEGRVIQHVPGIGLLGYGCMRWPKDDNGEIDQVQVDRLVDMAIAHGITYFDSAPMYSDGKNEQATAKALSRYPRESYLIATKLSNFHGRPTTLDAGIEMFQRSLEIFSTDHIDYYLLHSIKGMDSFNERFGNNGLIDYLVSQRAAGHIRHLGFSFHGDNQAFDEVLALNGKYHWDFVQIQMNFQDWAHASGRNGNADHMYAELERLGIPVIVMEPLRGGSLATLPASLSDNLKQREPGSSIASWAFRFCGSFPNVQVILSGMTCQEHLTDNLNTFIDFKPLSDDDFAALDHTAEMLSKYPVVHCTDCRYCMPCPYGVNIPGIFKFYNDNVNAGTYATTPEQKHYAHLRRRYLLKYDKAVPTIRQASHCIGCGRCLDACPQHIAIPNELHRIDAYIEKLKRNEA